MSQVNPGSRYRCGQATLRAACAPRQEESGPETPTPENQTRCTLADGEAVLTQGEEGDAMYIVKRGLALGLDLVPRKMTPACARYEKGESLNARATSARASSVGQRFPFQECSCRGSLQTAACTPSV